MPKIKNIYLKLINSGNVFTQREHIRVQNYSAPLHKEKFPPYIQAVPFILRWFYITCSYRRRMSTNDSVISWLNKQLTNAKIRDPGFRIAPPPKNISHAIGGDMSAQAMTTMQPSMATEQKNNNLVASTPIQMQDKLVNHSNKTGKENKNDENDTEKIELDPKYLLPSTSQPGMPKSVSHEKGARRKTVLSATKQQSVYFNGSNIQ